MSSRVLNTDPPYIAHLVDRYADVADLTLLAQGSVSWGPPQQALEALAARLNDVSTHRYGDGLGIDGFREHILHVLEKRGVSTKDMEICVTPGGNQAFMNAALALCDNGDHAVILAPFYFGHEMALQLAGAQIHICPFIKDTLAPDFVELERLMNEYHPKLVVLTTPNNPSGHVFSHAEVTRIIQLCRAADAWLVADQTYEEFLFDDAVHVYPCGSQAAFNYEKIVHVFSYSKIFGIPGWRVGYMLFPAWLTEQMMKIQDTLPTHAAHLSQHLAWNCLKLYYPISPSSSATLTSAEGTGADATPPTAAVGPASSRYSTWTASIMGPLTAVRDAVWAAIQPMGGVLPKGAFYFLVPVPPMVDENEAVDILARQYGALLMPGSCFGAPHHLRLSYGDLTPGPVLETVCDRLRRGCDHLRELSLSRVRELAVTDQEGEEEGEG